LIRTIIARHNASSAVRSPHAIRFRGGARSVLTQFADLVTMSMPDLIALFPTRDDGLFHGHVLFDTYTVHFVYRVGVGPLQFVIRGTFPRAD